MSKNLSVGQKIRQYLKCAWDYMYLHRKGAIVIGLATLVFFWPLVIRMSSYSEGGDAMFNAWEMSRNQHCILREGCKKYTDANIYFPNKDTMLYSETQFSSGLITLPIHFLNQNPIFQYNLLTILSFFFTGLFMYLLLKHLNKGKELYAIAGGLIWEFAPIKMAAIFHLQNLCILCLPLIVLFMLRYFETQRRRYLVGIFLALLYVFYASWYQMAFFLLALGTLLACIWLFKLARPKMVLIIGGVVLAAAMATFPLAKEYVRFSKQNKAGFSVSEQALYSSSVADYFIPHQGTAVGKIFYKVVSGVPHNSYNLDSYSYHGIVLYAVAAILIVVAFRWRKKNKELAQNYKIISSMLVLMVISFVVSLGPLLKLKGAFMYHLAGTQVAIPLPYILVDAFLPQLSFIRAIGRVSILFLFGLCVLLAYVPVYLDKSSLVPKHKRWATLLIMGLIIFELMPLYRMPMSRNPSAYNHYIPEVYLYVKSNSDIDNLIVLQAEEYPNVTFWTARTEVVLWSGYHNRKIFNGYSGIAPKNFEEDYADYVNFEQDDITKMKDKGLRYVIVDKDLYKNKQQALENLRTYLPNKPYEDSRYVLYKL